jgi:23S rRNA (guanosine2251-2'-O)-methyltransferase
MKRMPHLIPGFHGVRDALSQGPGWIKEVWIAEGKKTARTAEIIQMAEEQKIPVRLKKGPELSGLLPDIAHQGIVALAEKFTYSDVDYLINISLKNKDQGLLIAADHITDEGNLGSLIRTAAFFGVHGLILPKKRSAGVSAQVLKRSSGAYVHLPIARVVNLGRTLDLLKDKGFWIIGASGGSSESIYQFDWKRDLVLVLGNEQRGLSRSVRERCHQIVSIPTIGHVESLNVGVAGGVILSEIFRQRGAV